ncbi:MAG: hypothetical protein JNM93_05690 [Bacteriovoracaceae bacterium]|nr:hypothetical protein [Bacteriovoracaceae bacterium]
MRNFLITFFLFIAGQTCFAQGGSEFSAAFDDDVADSAGSDIFTDFNEDLDESKILEDERFYRYARFFSFNVGVGTTSYTGNRGAAYYDNNPTYHISVNYFFNFRTSFNLGLEYSKHTMFIDTETVTYDFKLGAVETSMLRPFFGLRHYIDTTNLGTAITYANPYLAGRLEYWYQTNKFVQRPTLADQSGGGIGMGFGFGLEFPMEVKESYINFEFLYHRVNFFDKFTQDYKQDTNDTTNSTYGYDDLMGDAYSVTLNYVISW